MLLLNLNNSWTREHTAAGPLCLLVDQEKRIRGSLVDARLYLYCCSTGGCVNGLTGRSVEWCWRSIGRRLVDLKIDYSCMGSSTATVHPLYHLLKYWQLKFGNNEYC